MQSGSLIATFGGKTYVVREPQREPMDTIFDAALASAKEATNPVPDCETSLRMYGFKFWQALRVDQPEVDSVEKALEILGSVSQQEIEDFQAKVKALTTGSNQ